MPDPRVVRATEAENRRQSLVLLGAMGVLLLILGYALAGRLGVVMALVMGTLMFARGPDLSVDAVVRHFKGRALGRADAPVLTELLAQLAARAELPVQPVLIYIPSEIPNAFAAGRRQAPIVAVTDGLLRRMQPRELAGVLAHEVGHIRNGDLKVMRVADFVTRTAGNFSFVGKMMLIFSLPQILAGEPPMKPLLIVLLLAAPTLSILLQLALSRTREFAADLAAAELTGDPLGLASALQRLDGRRPGLFRQIFLPKTDPMPSYLRTHPKTPERVARLQALAQSSARMAFPGTRDDEMRELASFARPVVRRPVVASWLWPR